jgi:DHA1 family bicyclomycin/chloramphenicol resistance-like MFS transporter
VPETRSRERQLHSRGESALASYRAVLSNGAILRLGLICAFGTSAFATYLTNAPTLFITVYGVAPQNFGWYFGINVVGLIVASQINRALLHHHAPWMLLRRACVLAVCAAAAMFGFSLIGVTAKWLVLMSLFFVLSTFPVIMTNAMALAQGEDRARGGVVAAGIGAIQSLVAVSAAAVSSVFANGTAIPMAATMCMGAMMCALLVARPYHSPRQGAPA